MQRSGSANPEIQMQAEKYVGTGYQRLLTFEVPGGGFSLFGSSPAQVFLTAYGLMEFSDMERVYPVDKAVIQRAAQWLLKQQQPDGTWQTEDRRAGRGRLGVTAFAVWSLIQAGYRDTPQVAGALSYVREFALQEQDAYNLALAANALVAYDPQHATSQAVLARLYDWRVQEPGLVYWPIGSVSLMGAVGPSGSLETTALAAMALMRGGVYPDAVSGALAFLIQGKDSWGTWGTTQATIWSLKALLLASEVTGQAAGTVTLQVSLNGEQTHTITIDPHNADVVHALIFDRGFSPGGANRVQIEVEGAEQPNLMYQVATSYYVPWSQVEAPATAGLMSINLAYDRTTLAVNDEVTVQVDARLNQEGVVRMALIDLGVPPGFTVIEQDLARLVEAGMIARYELTGRQIIIYLENFSSAAPLNFSYRMRARFPMRAQTPPSSAYDYYNPTQSTLRPPLGVVVRE